jgi:hypothetical protein
LRATVFYYLNFKTFYMTHKIATTFKKASDAKTMHIGHCVGAKMDNNPNFPDPPEALAAVQKLLPEAQTAINNASRRDKEMVSIKNDKKAQLVGLLSILAEYVTNTCNGDKSMLLSSGFELTRAKGERPLTPVSSLQVTIDKPHEATTRIKRVIGARVYIHQYTMDPLTDDSVWTDALVTDTSHTFTDLPSAVKHWFRVVVVGANGQKEYSPTVARIIQ